MDYASGDAILLDAGVAYTVSEIPNAGYNLVDIQCIDSDTLTNVGNPFTSFLGQNITCTATNNDIAADLSLLKIVINNNGGTALPADFALTLTGADGIHALITTPQPMLVILLPLHLRKTSPAVQPMTT